MMSLFGSSGVAMLQRTQQGLLWARKHECTAQVTMTYSCKEALREKLISPGDPSGVALEGTLRRTKERHVAGLAACSSVGQLRAPACHDHCDAPSAHTKTMHIGRPCYMSLGIRQMRSESDAREG